ncbi:hypothetical protein C8F01DRAFT_1101482 [Mycena amicta]|nr:hypothetical protein C8F01DRAFT_1101482 [Mycena amicta]
MSDVPPPSGPTTTLDKVDIVSFDVPAPPTAAITAAEGAATVITAVTAPTRTLRPSSSLPFFHAPHDEELDDDDFWAPHDQLDKGKAKEKATPAPTPSTSRPPQHPLLVEAGYTGLKEVKRWAAPEHQSTRDNLEALSIGLCLLDSRVNTANTNIAEGLDGLHAQLVGLTSDIATLPQGNGGAGRGVDPALYNELVASSNNHNENFKRIVLRIQDLVAEQDALRSSVNTSVAAFTTSINALTSRIPQIVSQPSSNNDSLRSMLEDVINENGKRVRGLEDAAELTRAAPAPPTVYAQLQPPVSMQAQFAPQPLYAPQPTAQVPQAPIVSQPAQQPQPMLYTPQQQVYGPPAPQQQYQPAPQPQYQLQHVVPPQAVVDPRHEVALMPYAWPVPKSTRDWILDVMTRDVMRSARFTVRRGRDSQEIIMTFEAENMAAWFIGAWNGSNRRNVKGLQNVYASLNV